MIGRQRVWTRRATHNGNIDAEWLQPLFNQLSNRAIAQQQGFGTKQFNLAGRIEQPFAAFLRADNFAVVLRDGQHAHDDIFGDGDRVNACAIGDNAALRLQLRQRHAVDTGIDAVQPFHVGGGIDDRGHIALVIHVEPANFCLRRECERFFLGHEEMRLDPIGQARFNQGAHKARHYEFRFGHAAKAFQVTKIKNGMPTRSVIAMVFSAGGEPADQ